MLENKVNILKTRFAIGGSPAVGTREGLQWLMLARLCSLYTVLSVIVLEQVFRRAGGHPWVLAYGLLTLAFGFNFIQSIFIDKIAPHVLLTGINLLFDSVIISIWISQGGNLLVLMYLVQILVVALTFYQKGALASALIASFCLGIVKYLSQENFPFGEWAIYSSIFITLGLVGGYLSEELLRTTRRLQEKNRTIEKLTELHERILANMPTGLLTIDRNMQIHFLNPAAESILGKHRSYFIGKQLGEVEPELIPFFSNIESHKIEEDDSNEPEVSATGTEFHRSIFLEPRSQKGHARLQQVVELGRGENLKVLRGDVADLDAEAGVGSLLKTPMAGARVLLFQDVTKLRNLEDKLFQNEKLAAVGQLAAGIAHEIRNPLASISASIEMLKGSAELKDIENQRLMEIAIREVDGLNQLITEFLDFVKPENLKLKQVVLSELIEEICGALTNRQEMRAGIRLVKKYDTAAIATASPEKLRQVIWNLIINAVQAIKGEGEIRVGTTVISERRVAFWVEDTGLGMTDEVRQHLYEPFFTTKDKGTGLGLATSYKIIEAHRGGIEVDSKVGQGTKFKVFLPRA